MEEEIRKKQSVLPVIIVAAAAVVIISAVVIFFVFSNNSRRGIQKQLDLGARYLSELNFDKAAAAFRDAVRIDPEDEDALELFHDCYRKWMEHDAEHAYEICEAEYNTLNTILAEGPSTKVEELLIRVEELRARYAPGPTAVPTATPTEKPTPTNAAMVSPTPTADKTEDDDTSRSWRDIDFSFPLLYENAQYVLDRLVDEAGWEYGDHASEVFKESFDEAGNYVGLAMVSLVEDQDTDMCMYYQIPKNIDGSGLGAGLYSHQISMDMAYNEIVSAFTKSEEEFMNEFY